MRERRRKIPPSILHFLFKNQRKYKEKGKVTKLDKLQVIFALELRKGEIYVHIHVPVFVSNLRTLAIGFVLCDEAGFLWNLVGFAETFRQRCKN